MFRKSLINALSFFLLMLLIIPSRLSLTAQDIPTGTWRDHLPYKRSISVASTGEVVYCATANSLFKYDIKGQTTTTLSKANGLSDVGFSKLAWHPGTSTIIIAYANANLDLIRDGKIHNLSDIKRKNLPINKEINDITFFENDAWLATGFGIVVINLERLEIKDLYLIGDQGGYVNVNDIKFFNDTVYAATNQGILRAAQGDFLADFSNWHLWNTLPYPDAHYNTLAFFNGVPYVNLYAGSGKHDTLYQFVNGQWNHLVGHGYEYLHQLDVFHGKLLMTKSDNVLVITHDLDTFRHIYNYTPGTSTNTYLQATEAVLDDKEFVWIADLRQGLVFIYDQWAYGFIAPNGPATSNAFQMAAVENDVWVASGAYSSTWSMTFRREGVFHYDGFNWKTITYQDNPALDTIFDFVCIAPDPVDLSKVYVGTWHKGIVVLKEGKVEKIYDHTNSTMGKLENTQLGIYEVAVGGITFDQQGNLWVSTAGVTRSLSVMRPNGVWSSFDISSPGLKMSDMVSGKIVIDRIGQKWVLLGRGNGIQVFNDNNTLDNIFDDLSTNVNNIAGQGGLPSMLVTDLAIDLDGRLWIGSDKGIAVIYSPENVFTGNFYDAQQILVNQDGFDQYLLENETVTAIAVDGGNRKWIGTESSGVFLLSADGTKELARFHEGNSPLLSNGIRSIAINHRNGEVFFGTDYGIISYRADATKAEPVHGDVKVFPNPVHPGFAGPITINGLVRDADVKITTVSGDVVFSTRSQGGTAVWDGNDLSGKKVGSGVYLVFSSDQDGIETAVAKILFIR